MLSHRSDHRRNRAMQARHLLSAAALSLAVAACQPAQQEPAKPRPPVILSEADAPPRPMKPELPPLFDDIERRTFQFFWDTTNEINGLTPDRYPSRPFASIASVGFALTAYPIGIENGWVSRNQAIDRTLTTLKKAVATTAGSSFRRWIPRC
ncbi:hypothetical protein G6F31_019508 [Rhizopus arrhizus]|nr:hypothetical protein G6F31_019508 [Rhizopus arrhizus]